METLLSNRYQLIKSIGKGGMGEVFLAFDKRCEREIALKQIRQDLQNHPHIRKRFLKEAHITSQLMHPAIIPIYSIEMEGANIYYTMPFVEGDTLKQIIRQARQQQKKGTSSSNIGGSILSFIHVFITICQAVAYAHTKGILHRDLKPENIIIGKFGEILILDWGLAKILNAEEEESFPVSNPLPEITRLGKVVGTVAYMAPERALGQGATKQTDIYALGAILYQLLTLKNPFSRGTLEEFRKNMKYEELVDPIHAAPDRDISKILSQITLKCLNPNPRERYQAVDHLIQDLENYVEGKSDWYHVAQLDCKQKNNWELQQTILVAEPLAFAQSSEKIEKANFMISHQSFSDNIRLDFSVRLHEGCTGFGILFNVPEPSERRSVTEGYCLWLGSENEKTTKLLRSRVEVMQMPDIFLKKNQTYSIRIEKIDKSIHFILDDILQFSYVSHFPLMGTHVGLVSKDNDFCTDLIHVYVRNLNLTVNCLAIPDAFLAQKNFSQALSEYRRIAYSFPDRMEGREALFRSGLTLIAKAKVKKSTVFLDQALIEFEKLRGLSGGPLEYLGKALVYQEKNEPEEEVKCFEIAYRRYPHHPLLPILQEHIISRLHEVSRKERICATRFILLATKHLSTNTIDAHTMRLLSSFQKHTETLPFIEELHTSEKDEFSLRHISMLSAFLLAQPYIISEICDEISKDKTFSPSEFVNGLVCLIELGAINEAALKYHNMLENDLLPNMYKIGVELILNTQKTSLQSLLDQLFSHCTDSITFPLARVLIYVLDRALDNNQTDLVCLFCDLAKKIYCPPELLLILTLKEIWACLMKKNFARAEVLFSHFSEHQLITDSSLLPFLYGCFIVSKQGLETAKAHFAKLSSSPYPKSWALGYNAIKDEKFVSQWIDHAFFFEKKELYRQLFLFYHCLGDIKKANDCLSFFKSFSCL